jgi:hypothetical protein
MGRKTGLAVLFIGLIFVATMLGALSIARAATLQDLAASMGGTNRALAGGRSYLIVEAQGFPEGLTSLFNMNASAVFSSAILEGSPEFASLNVSFVTRMPANATDYYGYEVEALFLSIRSNVSYYDRLLAVGHYQPTYPVTGIRLFNSNDTGHWNVTVRMFPETYPTLNIPQNSDWLSFTSQDEAYLSVGLHGYGQMTSTNGTTYFYWLSTWFDFNQTLTTFYRFSYPPVALLGYGASIFIVIASVCFLLYAAWRQKQKRRN